ncbi:MAG: 4-(cytidine 5'-diphospho)-2-C-methyl-D-erythritol kinase [Acidobacteriaceae bacterium]
MATTSRSYCKINLGLAIGPGRTDGFHALTTLYQTVGAYDLVTVSAAAARGRKGSIAMTCNHAEVPVDARNTAWKMVEKALPLVGVALDVAIHIEKRLPVQGGLGAGSANAAAALIALERELKRQPELGAAVLTGPEKLLVASEVGSDVPLFLIGGSVLGVGRGEEVYPLPDLPPTHCVLALPEVGVSTPQAFRDWDAMYTLPAGPAPGLGLHRELTRLQASDKLSELSRALASAMCEPYSSGVLPDGEDHAENPVLALVRTGIENDFEEVVFRQHPPLGAIKRILMDSPVPEQAAIYAALSGSGSALFGLYRDKAAAQAAVGRLTQQGIRALQTVTLTRRQYWAEMLGNC